MSTRVCVFFFFQAEDGIRDLTVTGVQTCALPIFHHYSAEQSHRRRGVVVESVWAARGKRSAGRGPGRAGAAAAGSAPGAEIGRASWRGREEISVGAGSLKKKKTNLDESSNTELQQ